MINKNMTNIKHYEKSLYFYIVLRFYRIACSNIILTCKYYTHIQLHILTYLSSIRSSMKGTSMKSDALTEISEWVHTAKVFTDKISLLWENVFFLRWFSVGQDRLRIFQKFSSDPTAHSFENSWYGLIIDVEKGFNV